MRSEPNRRDSYVEEKPADDKRPSSPPRSSPTGLQRLDGDTPIGDRSVEALAQLAAEHPHLMSQADVEGARAALGLQKQLDKAAPGHFRVLHGFVNHAVGDPLRLVVEGRWNGADLSADTFAGPKKACPDLEINAARLRPDGVFVWTVTLPREAEAKDAAECVSGADAKPVSDAAVADPADH
jgi:hypothetical protein